MGTKARALGPPPPVPLADLDPADHRCHHLERTLDLGVVRDLARASYPGLGWPPIDPVVFCTL